MQPYRAPAIVILCALPASAQSEGVASIVKQLWWDGPTWSGLVMLSLLMLSIVLAFVIVGLRRSYREKSTDKRTAEQLFNEAAERCKLTTGELQTVRRLLLHDAQTPPQALFQSAALFERCVHAEIEEAMRSSLSSAAREDLDAEISAVRKKLGYSILPLEHPLVSTRNIALGQVGSIFGKSHRSALVQRAVVMGNNEFGLRLQYDPRHEEPVRFAPGNQLKLAFARQNDGFYGISLTVVEADSSGSVSFNHTLDLKRNQLRQFVRVEVSAPVKFRLLKTANPEKSEFKRGQAAEGKIGDISGGGVSFLHTGSLKPGDIISVSFNLPPYSFSGLSGKVLRVSLQEGKTQTLYRHHVEFVTLEQRLRDQIMKYVFERQRQNNQWR
jgi:c-di-GMP-binding flagellar brake protein YcgR